MKEAAGEANMTVITIVLIAIVLGVGTLVVTSMMNNASTKSTDIDANNVDTCPNGYTWSNNQCIKSS